jgi:hypothetical protein
MTFSSKFLSWFTIFFTFFPEEQIYGFFYLSVYYRTASCFDMLEPGGGGRQI